MAELVGGGGAEALQSLAGQLADLLL